MTIKPISVLLAAAALASCTTTNRVKLTGCDHVSGWSDQIRAMADTAYPYAQLAVNAYDDHRDDFVMGAEWRALERHPNNAHGMAYDIWERQSTAGGREVVLAFRGTEFATIPDWRDGNFGTKQNADGVAVFDQARLKYPAARYTVVGHSLGGGIATQISLSRPSVSSYIFNSSPRFKAPAYPESNVRVSVAEAGEVLKAVRILGREATQDYYSLNCSGGIAITQHFSKPLATCLTRIASWDDPAAMTSLERNNLAKPFPASHPGRADCRKWHL